MNYLRKAPQGLQPALFINLMPKTVIKRCRLLKYIVLATAYPLNLSDYLNNARWMISSDSQFGV